MQFRTEINLQASAQQIDYSSAVFFIGSCFSNNIGDKLCDAKIKTLINPFGVVFNPVSIAEQIDIITNKTKLLEADVFEHNGIFKSFTLHSVFNNKNKKELVDSVNQQILEANHSFRTATHIFITLGSAFAYKHILSNKIASNCHKLPQSNFEKVLLSYEDVTKCLKSISSKVKLLNPDAELVFTVSPVKHIKDGIVNDNLSKSILIAAANAYVAIEKNATYFPAYELVNNDLRDYRFYAKDLAHPTEQAIEYVFEKFASVYFSNETSKLIDEVLQIVRAMQHIVSDDNELEKNKFVQNMLQKINEVETKLPIKLNAAKNHFNSLLHLKNI